MGLHGQVYLQPCVVTSSGLAKSRQAFSTAEIRTDRHQLHIQDKLQPIRQVQPFQLVRQGSQFQVHLMKHPSNEQTLDPTPMWSAILRKEEAILPQIGDSFSHLLTDSSNATIM
jgi:hypothetical protein